ncbi:hypothetical protein ACOSZF_23200 [Cytobacillus firmus]|uniref:hypothetical protein n=1 Tax=Cytobacillus firmus TaxID=1399 RepID=UPI003BA31894
MEYTTRINWINNTAFYFLLIKQEGERLIKLLLCKNCGDIFNLDFIVKSCRCGVTGGKYLDQRLAEYFGDAIPIGIANDSLISAINNQPYDGMGELFKAFVIPVQCHTFIRKEDL